MKKTHKPNPTQKSRTLTSSIQLALESRLLFDGAVVATADLVDDKAVQDNAKDVPYDNPTGAEAAAHDNPAFSFADIGHNLTPLPPPDSGHSIGSAGAPNLIVIDPRAEDIHDLLAKPPANTEVKVLDLNKDGYQQIADILESRGSTTNLVLQTAEESSKLWLGTSQIMPNLRSSESNACMEWGDNLDSSAKITVHGAPISGGNALLQHIYGLTGSQTSWNKDSAYDAYSKNSSQTETDDKTQIDNTGHVQSTNTTLVFVDTTVSGYQDLLKGIDPKASVILLDKTTDEIQQIAGNVSLHSNVSAIHIISHGSEGQLKLGSVTLNQATLDGIYSDSFTRIRDHLSKNADIMIYGCDVASGTLGSDFISALANKTGADIAASTNLTGAAYKGGDWVLEKNVGQIDSQIIIDEQAQQKFVDVLRSPNNPKPLLANAPASNYKSTLASTLQVNGTSASITSDVIGGQQLVQLTTPTHNQTGSAWSKFQIDLTKNFTIDFDVYLGTLDGSGADGIAFALQNSGPNVTGGFGGGLGVQNISNAVAIEFDTYNNGANTAYAPVADIANDHISMYQPKTTTFSGQSLGTSAQKDVGNIENDTWYNCVVNWNASSKSLSYTFAGPAGTVAGGATGVVSDSAVLDPNTVFGDNNVYFGWTASTGGSINDQRIAINSITNLSPTIDLNGSGSGEDRVVTFTENGAAVSIADPTATVADADNTNMESAKIVLTDKQAFDKLLVGGSSAATGTVNGLSYTLVDNGKTITVTLTGSASKDDYADAIKTITFSNSSETPSGIDRHVKVTVNDGSIDSSPAITTIHVLPVNDPPSGANKTITISEDTPYTINQDDFGFSDPKDHPDNVFTNVIVTSIPPTSQGEYKLNGVTVTANQVISVADISAGLLTFIPKANVSGNSFGGLGFKVQDNGGTANGGLDTDRTANTLNFNIVPVNDPPVAISSSPVGAEDTPIPVSLAGTDGDGTVKDVTVTKLPPATQGILYLEDGKTPVVANTPLTPAQAAGLIFKPAPNFNGLVNIPFTVTDNEGLISEPARASITVNPVNDPPVAISGDANTPEDTPVKVNLTGSDVDGAVSTVTVTALPKPTEGILYLPGGITPATKDAELTPFQAANLVFKPALNFNGLVDITFTVKDNSGSLSEPGSYVVDVQSVNDDPEATPASVSGPEDSPVPVSLTGTDADGPITAVTVTKLPPAAQGILTKADGTPVEAGVPLKPEEAASLKFVPAPNFSGQLTVPFTATDSDGQIASPPADLTITITPVNDPPVAISISPVADEDTPIPVSLTGNDIDGTVKEVTVTSLPSPNEGILYLADGKTPVVANTPLTPAQAAGLIFKPAPNFNGLVNIPFTVTDNEGFISEPAKASLTITPVNDPPVAISGSANTLEDTPVNINLTGSDVDGAVSSVTVTALPAASKGILYLPDGKTPVEAGTELTPYQAANLVFKPALNFNGLVDVPFTVKDDGGLTSDAGRYVIDVANVNDDPEATPASVSGPEDSPVPVSLTGTDADGPITAVTVTKLPPAAQGILTKADGTPVEAGVPLKPEEAASLKFVPAPNFSGQLTVPFTATDSDGQIASPPADLTITITPVNDPPVAISISPVADEDTPIPVSLTGNDIDGTVKEVTVTSLPSPNEGILYLADGKTPVVANTPLTPAQAAGLIFKPAPNFNGLVNIPFTVTDNEGFISEPAKASLTITPVNDPPVAISGSANTLEDTPVNINLTGSDVDGAVSSVTVTALPAASKGILYLPDGKTPVEAGTELTPYQAANLVFKPALNFNGLVDVPFTVKDDGGLTSDAGRYVIDVANVNDDPEATPASVSGPEDSPVPVSLTGTDADGPITAVTVTKLPPAAQGILTKADGTPVEAGVPLKPEEAASLKFVPAPNFSGQLTVPFMATDSDGQIASPPADLTITITPVNDPPVAISISPVADEDTPIPVSLTGNDIDGTVKEVTVTSLPSPNEGILYLADGKTPVVANTPLTPAQAAGLIFKPAPDFNGSVVIPYTVTDSTGLVSEPAQASIFIAPVNDPPVAISASTNTPQDKPVSVSLTGTDVDGEVSNVTVTELPPSTKGVLYLADGKTPVTTGTPLTPEQAAGLIFKPAPNFNGLVDIRFTVKDDSGAASKPGRFVIDVNFVDVDPIATPILVNGLKDTPVPVSLTGTDNEGPISGVTVVKLPPASQGILTKADGEPVKAGVPLTPEEAAGLQFVPAPNFTGSLIIPFTVTDSVGQVSSPPANLTIYIDPTPNVGALIMLSNPAPPLFSPIAGGNVSLIPLSEASALIAKESPFQIPALGLYQDLQDCDLYLTGSLRNQVVLEKHFFSFSVPAGIFRHTNSNEELEYSATKVDGSALPQWLKFHSNKLSFTGVPPKGAINTDVVLIAKDNCGNKVYAQFRVRVNNEHDYSGKGHIKKDKLTHHSEKVSQTVNQRPIAQGKPSFNEQVCSTAKLNRLMEARQLLNSLNQFEKL